MLAALIAVIALLAGLGCGFWLARKGEQVRWEREVNRRKRDFTSTLVVEVEGILARLNSALKPDYRELPAVVQENYFTAFDANVNVLPLLDESDAQNVLAFYQAAKRQVDALRELHGLYVRWQSGAIGPEVVERLHKQIQETQQEITRSASPALKSLKKY